MILDHVDDSRTKQVAAISSRIAEFRSRYGESPQTEDMTRPEQQEYESLTSVELQNDLALAQIDLYGLMRMRRPDGFPRWALANPNSELGLINGATIRRNGWWRTMEPEFHVLTNSTRGHYVVVCPFESKLTTGNRARFEHGEKIYGPKGGFPVLPQRIRELISLPAVQKCHTTAVLYQPTGWEELKHAVPDPDPALLVKRYADSEFECLAVWGHDGPHIKEFVV